MDQLPLFTLESDGPKLCSPRDFSRAKDIPVQTLYSATSSGRIVYTKIGGRMYLHVESAEKFLLTYRKYTTEEK